MQSTKTIIFYAYPCILRVQVLICFVKTRLQRIIIRFCFPGLSVVSDPRNVLRHQQGRLTM